MIIVHVILGFLLLQETTASQSSIINTSIVDIGYAKYQGTVIQDAVSNATHTQFLGIRFAAPPIGMARFKEPKPPATVPGVQQANVQPPICFQSGLGAAPTSPYSVVSLQHNYTRRADPPQAPVASESEDCLFLNVYVPGDHISAKKNNLPVIVWIHGGAYVQGSESATGFGGVYDGNAIVRESGERIVLVTIQYRLGIFGFLAGQKIKDGGALNAGLYQQFALKWVQKNIDKFGGDPHKVTIWGESAGAGSVLQHIIANGGETSPPLFWAAITSSTYLPPQYLFNDRIPESIYKQAVAHTNCTSATDSLLCLRLVDVNILQAANVNIVTSGFFGTVDVLPVIDGALITKRPTQSLKERKLNGKFLYSVTNTFEGTIFVDSSTEGTLQVDQFISQLFPGLRPKEVKMATAQYAGLGSNFTQAIAILGESFFICPTYYLQTAFGGNGYKALFAIPPGTHGLDVNYYFPGSGTPGEDLPFANADFVKAFTESFPNFAISLDPNRKWEDNITPLWNSWNGSNEMLFNKTEAGASDIRSIATSKALLDRCDYWESVSASTSQ